MFDEHYPEPDPNKVKPKDRWEKLYQSTDYLFGKEPSPFLKSRVADLSKGKAIDVAMGEGQNSVFLAEQGFDVEGIDICQTAVDRANALAKEKGVSLKTKCQDLDFYLMPLMGFDTIVMTHFHPVVRFFNEIRRGLKVGGTFLMEAYTVDHYKNLSSPNPTIEFEDCFKPNEPLKNLKDLRLIYYNEIPQGSSHQIQLIAKKIQS